MGKYKNIGKWFEEIVDPIIEDLVEKKVAEWFEKMKPTFTDPRDGQTYHTIQLDGLTWMAQNLNYDMGEGCWFYNNDPKNGKKYGRLYTWEAAKEACPPGWRLPTDEEWQKMRMSFGYPDNEMAAFKALIEGGRSGFSASTGGRMDNDGSFLFIGVNGYYWSSTDHNSIMAWTYSFYPVNGKVLRCAIHKDFGFSVRCVKI